MMQRHCLAIPAVDQFPAGGTTIKRIPPRRSLRSIGLALFSRGSLDRRFCSSLHIVTRTLAFHLAPVALAFGNRGFGFAPPIGRERAPNVDLFFEFPLLVAPHIPPVAGVRFNHGSLTRFRWCFLCRHIVQSQHWAPGDASLLATNDTIWNNPWRIR